MPSAYGRTASTKHVHICLADCIDGDTLRDGVGRRRQDRNGGRPRRTADARAGVLIVQIESELRLERLWRPAAGARPSGVASRRQSRLISMPWALKR